MGGASGTLLDINNRSGSAINSRRCWLARNAHAVMSRDDIAFKDPGWVAEHQRPGRHILCDNACRRNDAVIANGRTGQNYRMCAYETIIADPYVIEAIIDEIVRQNCHAEGYARISSDVDSARIGFVQLGA